ncbi:hypothetical protein SASC598O02_001780, partial [Snodgrassella alvi SCGC AB-598-O02]
MMPIVNSTYVFYYWQPVLHEFHNLILVINKLALFFNTSF